MFDKPAKQDKLSMPDCSIPMLYEQEHHVSRLPIKHYTIPIGSFHYLQLLKNEGACYITFAWMWLKIKNVFLDDSNILCRRHELHVWIKQTMTITVSKKTEGRSILKPRQNTRHSVRDHMTRWFIMTAHIIEQQLNFKCSHLMLLNHDSIERDAPNIVRSTYTKKWNSAICHFIVNICVGVFTFSGRLSWRHVEEMWRFTVLVCTGWMRFYIKCHVLFFMSCYTGKKTPRVPTASKILWTSFLGRSFLLSVIY